MLTLTLTNGDNVIAQTEIPETHKVISSKEKGSIDIGIVKLKRLTDEGLNGMFHKGLTRVPRDGVFSVEAFDNKMAGYYGEKPLRVRGDSLSVPVKVFRVLIIGAAKDAGVKLDKMPDTIDGIVEVARAAKIDASIIKAHKAVAESLTV